MITGMSVFSEENSEENHYFTVFFTSGENSEENHYFIVFFTSEENSEEKSQRSEIIFPTHEKKLEKHEVIPVRIEERTIIIAEKKIRWQKYLFVEFCYNKFCHLYGY